jgi:hypothetical protein
VRGLARRQAKSQEDSSLYETYDKCNAYNHEKGQGGKRRHETNNLEEE